MRRVWLGTKTARPHYHAIIFGLQLNDLTFYKLSSTGQKLYNSNYLQSCWCDLQGQDYKKASDEERLLHTKGFIVVGSVTPESCAYTARYCTKKAYQNGDIYSDLNMTPEFTLMSRRPGIGAWYYSQHSADMFSFDNISIATENGGITFKPPRYFHKLKEKEVADFFHDKELYSENNHIAEDFKRAKLTQTSKEYLEMLATEEKVKESQIRALQRTL